ncbi:Inosine monophosphate cyclohydrolase [Dissulfuribacter thermophilus]|uniref:Inosine monophosphate cyclohydrolase n=1 Tax=Dissulfuribacter thermophilus TaxID=1156395 RepID=A0A1B9F6S2_9BACT|nr:IMP cyclohydrolase [Dissulfuribacter thermophilus]OCC15544.1 Inosine monophosphate cyclohydrolase [Dissulfuribacter thermophilus]
MAKIQRALISVTDKTGVAEFAKELEKLGVEIVSTGGTARVMREAGVSVKDVSELTGFPEMMDGRVKTLHPKVHGGILAIRDNKEHVRQMEDNGVPAIDLVVVNLYAFEKTVQKPDVTLAEAIENIDIGGPTLLRSSAKNFRYVTVITDPDDYEVVLNEMKQNGGETTLETRFRLARKVFELTSNYDKAITEYLSKIDPSTDEYFK